MRSKVLAAWEFDGKTPPHVVASVEDAVAEIELLEERNGDRRLVFRTANDDGSWTLARGTPFFLPYYGGFKGAYFDRELRRNIADSRSTGHFCRVFHWGCDDALMWRVSVAPTGYGVCQALFQGVPTSAVTPFFVEQDISDWSSSRTNDWLKGHSTQTDSALGFALRFHLMTREQRLAQVFGFGEDEAEYLAHRDRLERLMLAALWTDAHIWQAEERWGWRIGARQGFQMLDGDGNERLSRRQFSSPHLDFWSSALRRFGPLRANTNRVTLEQFWNGVQYLGQVTSDIPSMHEQLEARLELRDWARDHLPPNESAEMQRLQS